MILNEAAEIWVYGYGGRGRALATRLVQDGLTVCGFLDRNPEQYAEAVKQKCILRPDRVKPTPNSIAICSIANVFAHAEIAEMLAEQGFTYIVYKSFQENRAGKTVDFLYDSLTSVLGFDSIKGQEIPAYTDTIRSNDKLSMDKNGMLCVDIPVELLFGPSRTYFESSLLYKDEDLLNTIPNKSLLYFTPPQKMMQYFMGEADEKAWERCKQLWCACRNAQSFVSPSDGGYSEEEQNRNLEERYVIFQKMNQLFGENPWFFWENPISVIWNDKGWFNIQDGNNRAAFLLSKGLYSIPAKLTAADYSAWMGTGETSRQVKSVLNKRTVELRSPILHPQFKKVTSALEYYSHRKVIALCEWLWKRKIDPAGLSVYECYCSNDLCGSHLARIGGKLTVSDTDEQMGLHKALDKLYRLDRIRYGGHKQDVYQIVLSNHVRMLEEPLENGLQAEWYVLEFVDVKDAEIETIAARFSLGEPEYLMRQLVGSKVYKVVAIKGKCV